MAGPTAAEDRALGKERLARRIRRWTLVIAIILAIAMYACFGARYVPPRMDTVPDIPAGSFCVIDKRRSTVQAGSHVFLELPGHGVVLSRVESRDGDRLRIVHPNGASAVPDSRTLGALSIDVVIGTVLGAFKPNAGGSGG